MKGPLRGLTILSVAALVGGCGVPEAIMDEVRQTAKEEIDAHVDELMKELLDQLLDTVDLPLPSPDSDVPE